MKTLKFLIFPQFCTHFLIIFLFLRKSLTFWSCLPCRCDFQELCRYLVDDFVIEHCRKLCREDFLIKNEDFSAKRKGRREYLHDSQTDNLVKGLNQHFQSKVAIPRIRIGEKQELETLINEEAFLFAMFLRNERTWTC